MRSSDKTGNSNVRRVTQVFLLEDITFEVFDNFQIRKWIARITFTAKTDREGKYVPTRLAQIL
jgi:hypothetical protein